MFCELCHSVGAHVNCQETNHRYMLETLGLNQNSHQNANGLFPKGICSPCEQKITQQYNFKLQNYAKEEDKFPEKPFETKNMFGDQNEIEEFKTIPLQANNSSVLMQQDMLKVEKNDDEEEDLKEFIDIEEFSWVINRRAELRKSTPGPPSSSPFQFPVQSSSETPNSCVSPSYDENSYYGEVCAQTNFPVNNQNQYNQEPAQVYNSQEVGLTDGVNAQSNWMYESKRHSTISNETYVPEQHMHQQQQTSQPMIANPANLSEQRAPQQHLFNQPRIASPANISEQSVHRQLFSQPRIVSPAYMPQQHHVHQFNPPRIPSPAYVTEQHVYEQHQYHHSRFANPALYVPQQRVHQQQLFSQPRITCPAVIPQKHVHQFSQPINASPAYIPERVVHQQNHFSQPRIATPEYIPEQHLHKFIQPRIPALPTDVSQRNISHQNQFIRQTNSNPAYVAEPSVLQNQCIRPRVVHQHNQFIQPMTVSSAYILERNPNKFTQPRVPAPPTYVSVQNVGQQSQFIYPTTYRPTYVSEPRVLQNHCIRQMVSNPGRIPEQNVRQQNQFIRPTTSSSAYIPERSVDRNEYIQKLNLPKRYVVHQQNQFIQPSVPTSADVPERNVQCQQHDVQQISNSNTQVHTEDLKEYEGILNKYRKEGNQYICQLCSDYSNHNIAELARHIRLAHREREFQCKQCNVRYHTRGNLIRHNAIKHGPSPIRTSAYLPQLNIQENANFNTRPEAEELKEYEGISDKYKKEGNQYVCKLCIDNANRYNYIADLAWHIRSAHHEYKYKCKQCDVTFHTKGNLQRHIITNHGPSKIQTNWNPNSAFEYSGTYKLIDNFYVCLLCTEAEKKFVTHGGATNHIRLHHFGFRYICTQCGKKFLRNFRLEKHYKKIHNIVKSEFETTSTDNPSIYEEIHKDKTHRERASSKEHYRKEGKYYACNMCTQEFKNRTAIIRHVRTFHFGYRYKCDECEREFTYDELLKRHKRTHHKKSEQNKTLTKSTTVNNTKEYQMRQPSDRSFNGDNDKQQNTFISRKNPKVFTYKEIFKKINNHYICTYCHNSRMYRNSAHVSKHIRIHHYCIRFICTECGTKFQEKCQIKLHYIRAHGKNTIKFESTSIIKPSRYEQLNIADPKRTSYDKALKKINENYYVCRLCHARFKTNESISYHINEFHFWFLATNS